jgi:hypothetical protein
MLIAFGLPSTPPANSRVQMQVDLSTATTLASPATILTISTFTCNPNNIIYREELKPSFNL